MWIHLHRTVDPANGEQTYEIAFDTFAGFLNILDRHFGHPDEKHAASLVLDKLCQSNREFGTYSTDIQELMDILETMNETSRHHMLKRGLKQEMLSALAFISDTNDESFDAYVKPLNELGCCLCVLNTHSRRRLQHQPHHMHLLTTVIATATTATGIAARPIDLSTARGKLSAGEHSRCQAQGLCMYCSGVGHFATECPT